MILCEECGTSNWEIVIEDLEKKGEEGKFFLLQCIECKRTVALEGNPQDILNAKKTEFI